MTTVQHYSATRAGLAYGAMIFGAGFVLGTIRSLWLADAVGITIATLIELPIILAFAWWTCGKILARMSASPSVGQRAKVGALGLLVLLLLEMFIVLPLRGEGIVHFFEDFLVPERLIGFSGQLVFAALPSLRRQANSSASSA